MSAHLPYLLYWELGCLINGNLDFNWACEFPVKPVLGDPSDHQVAGQSFDKK